MSDEEATHQVRRANFIALVFGYNELAKRAETLGEKAFYALARDDAEKRALAAGAIEGIQRNPPLLTITSKYGPPHVVFTKTDIELMRKCVADFDAAQAAEGESK